jgi:hypothetical protein
MLDEGEANPCGGASCNSFDSPSLSGIVPVGFDLVDAILDSVTLPSLIRKRGASKTTQRWDNDLLRYES